MNQQTNSVSQTSTVSRPMIFEEVRISLNPLDDKLSYEQYIEKLKNESLVNDICRMNKAIRERREKQIPHKTEFAQEQTNTIVDGTGTRTDRVA